MNNRKELNRIRRKILGLFSLAIMIVVLDYMRTRFGLKPEEYKKEDIKFVEIK